jgi:beta-ureidopropionase / N-carbamoyl-L-amino-acid hydrolase
MLRAPSTRPTDSNMSAAAFGKRIVALCDELAQFSEEPGRLTCTYFSPPHRAVAAQLQSWMQAVGLEARIDTVGNVIGRYPSADPNAKRLIVGSHYDTVRDAGRYDGRLGIVTALVVIDELVRRQHRLPFHLEVIAFAEEEGVRFGTAYLGSRMIAGKFEPQVLERRDANGASVADAIRAAGGNPNDIPALARRPDDLLGYLEVHIEQGPVLLDADLPLGIVTAIAGGVRYAAAITGVAGHAGTVPMGLRHDAAAAAAELTLFLESLCRETPGLVGTVGQLNVPNGAINVIPGRCDLTLDIRSEDEGKLTRAIADVRARIAQIERTRGVSIALTELQRTPVVPCSPSLQRLLANALEKASIPVRRLPSGAGHDGVMFDGLCPVGMLFVRCGNGGVSHSPLETVTEADAGLAAGILLDVLMTIHDPL